MFKKTVLALSLLNLWSFSALAVEFPSGISETTVEMIQEAESKDANGTQTVVTNSSVQTSEEIAQNFLERTNRQEGWNSDKQVYTAVASARFAANSNPTQMTKMREIKYTEAVLEAKREIIEFIRSDISVDNLLSLPNTGLDTEIDLENQRLQRELDQASKEYVELLSQYDQAKAEEFAGVNYQDFVRDTIVGVLDRLQISVDIPGLKQEQRDRLTAAQNKLTALQAQMDALQKKVEENRNSIAQENVSSVQTLAAMPLSGAVVVFQAESLKDSEYEISVVVTWSEKQERFLKGLFEGQPTVVGQIGKTSLQNYIQSNDWSTAVGNRLFLDDKGELHILGIASWPIEGKGSAPRRKAEAMARVRAQAQIAVAVNSNVQAKTLAETRSLERKDASLETVESIAETIMEGVENMQLQGVSKRYGRTLKHPLFNQNMYVAIYDYAAQNVTAAKSMEAENYRTAKDIEKANQYSSGVKAGMEQSLQQQKNDRSAYSQGQNAGIQSQMQSSESRQQPSGNAAHNTGSTSSSSGQGVNEGGYAGAGETDFEF